MLDFTYSSLLLFFLSSFLPVTVRLHVILFATSLAHSQILHESGDSERRSIALELGPVVMN